MKIEVKNNVGFQPIELKLTIESERELCNLWHRMNVSEDTVNRNTNEDIRYMCNDEGTLEFWRELNQLVIKHNLEKRWKNKFLK